MVIKVLHVVTRMDQGGIESWLMNIVREYDRSRFSFEILAVSEQAGHFDRELHSLGSCPLTLKNGFRPFRLTSDVRRFLADRPRYDVIHCHLNLVGGHILKAAAGMGIRTRISHCHTDHQRAMGLYSFPKRLYFSRSQRLALRSSTFGIGCSSQSLQSFFGSGPEWAGRSRVHFYGIDLSRFKPDVDGLAIRRDLGVPEDALVVGHVGRFERVKNHGKIIRIAADMIQKCPRVHFVLVGTGPLKHEMELAAHDAGLDGRITFAGSRSDVPSLYSAVFDCAMLPSLYEGLSLAMLESMIGGCPIVIGSQFTNEGDVIPELMARLPVDASDAAWSEALFASIGKRLPTSDCVLRFRDGPFDSRQSVKLLEDLYLRLSTSS